MISEVVEIKYPSWFAPAFDTRKRYIDIWGGRGRGGSHTGTNYFLDLITAPDYFRGYFVRQSFNDIRTSLFQDFKDRIDENPTIDISDFRIQENEMRIIYIPTGNMIISKGVKKDGNRTAKMKSLAGATHVLVEEADEVGEADFDQMDDSLRTVKVENVQIVRIFNPPHKQHWIWRDYILSESAINGYFKSEPRADRNVLSLFATHKSNMRNMNQSTLDKFMSYKINKPEYFYTVIAGLISEGMKGRIYSGWESITNAQFNEIEERSILGLDFGENTGGLVEVKFKNERSYARELYYGGGSAKVLGLILVQLGITNQIIIADSAEPLKIAKLRSGWTRTELTPEEIAKYPQMLFGFNIHPVIKQPGSKVTGIGKVKDFKVHLTEDSVNFWKEYRDYKWALDKNKNPTDEPEDGSDHCFVAGTLIYTNNGLKPIELITPIDKVLTRSGYKDVFSAGKTGIKQTFNYTITCSVNDFSLNCTKEHKINTVTGWKEISKLKKKENIWLNNHSTILASTFIKTKNTLAGVQKSYIDMYGNTLTGLFRMVFTSTTLTIIHTTMKYLTYLLLMSVNALVSIQRIILKTTPTWLLKKWQESGRLQKNGTDQKLEENSTENKPSLQTLANLIYRKKNAKSVEYVLNLKHITLYFAETVVKVHGVESQGLMILKKTTSFVALNLLKINIQESKHVPVVVDQVCSLETGLQTVYDLSVVDVHEYYANGILVHNCQDPFRYVCMTKGRLF